MKSVITHGLEKRFDKDLNITSRKIADEYILDPIRQDVGNLKSFYTRASGSISKHPLIANSVVNSARFPYNFCYNHLKHI